MGNIMDFSEKDLEDLATQIAKKLNEDVKFEPTIVERKTSKETFDEFFKLRQKYLLNLPIAEIAWMFYLQGISDSGIINDEISMEEVNEMIETNEFIEKVQSWITMKNQNVTPLPQNPFIEVIEKVQPCGKCRARDDLYCPGTCEEVEVVKKINIEELTKDAKIG